MNNERYDDSKGLAMLIAGFGLGALVVPSGAVFVT